MSIVKVKYKNTGFEISGDLWDWRPHEGYFTIVDNDGGDPIRIELEDCESAIMIGSRLTKDSVGEEIDMLKKAQKDKAFLVSVNVELLVRGKKK
jgi:hypothetical protein